MSNFQKKYYYDFKSIDNQNHTVEIWQDTASVISSTKVIGAVDPFIVTMSGLSDKFQPVRGTGADLNLFATSSMQFMDLFTANIQEYQVRHYNNGTINWCGYLDTEIFSSDFSRQKNYPVSMTANDGFALLERLNYLKPDGSKYTELTTQWQVIQDIINKLNLPYNNVYVSLSTATSGITLAEGETIFHTTYCDNQNWYNEDDEPETCRKVLESILQPYGCFIIQDRCSLYVVDINTLSKATATTFKMYTKSFSYVSTESINLNLGDLSNIGFASNIQEIHGVPGFNKQVIKYMPYRTLTLIDYEEEIFSGTSINTSFGSLLNTWTRKYYESSDYWNKLNDYGKFCEMVGTNDNIGSSEKYLVISPVPTISKSNDNIFTYKKVIPDIVFSTSNQFYLKVEANMYLRTLEEKSELPSTLKSLQVKLKSNLTIGNKRYRWDSDFNTSKGWYPIEQPQHHTVLSFTNLVSTGKNTYSMSNISDTWTSLSTGYIDVVDNGNNSFTTQIRKPDPLYVPIPLNGSVTGNSITFGIGDYTVYNDAAVRVDITSQIQDIRLKDIKITIVDSEYKPIDDKDVEYVGYMDANYKNAGNEINLLLGSSKIDSPIEKGSLLGFNTNYYYLKNWTREGNTDCIERLLLRSIESNYYGMTLELSATIKRLNSGLGCLKYNNYLAGKVFMPTSLSNDYANNKSEITMQEIFADSLPINNIN